ncbi:putative chromatin structure remodeling complex protein STH1 [Papiliotrema laurentii]|uniref:Chromatin structure remodeling complex protein STH1 n=2 Tax=Opisthokonta TaxID=33154 RepID=A0AAD9FUC9_PAPLA|nr:putative chromatin structure remodeling complex protein STH1 [Papiliotrema laurentii]
MPYLDEEKKLEVIRGMSIQKIGNVRKRMSELQAAGATKENNAEFNKLGMVLDLWARAQMVEQRRASGGSPPSQNANGASPAPTQPPAPGTAPNAGHATLNANQIAQLRTQVASYHLLNRNQPIPSYVKSTAQGNPPPGLGGTSPAPNPLGSTFDDKVAEKTVESVVTANMENRMEVDGEAASGSDNEKITTPPALPYAMEFDKSTLVYPYNAYQHPDTLAMRDFDADVTAPKNKMQRMLVPSVMPRGLDPYLLMQERNRFVETRMQWRQKELEEMDSTLGSAESGAKDVPGIADEKRPDTNLGIKARIELLQLRLVGKQRLLREDMVRAMHSATQVPADRSQFRRFRNHTLRDARETEQAERRQRSEREQRGKQRHLSYIQSICDHGQTMISHGLHRGSTGDRLKRLGRAMQKLHTDTEREEAKRIERLAKERLKALKNDDEDAYLALLGDAKNSRIGHLLKQTDQYLETLAAAVVEQQNDEVHGDPRSAMPAFEVEDGPANEAMFGARRQDGEEENAETKSGKVDYYAVAHRIQEKVTGQASILTGGTLKDYQVKGLQWMISLYNNRLNGILADEMGLGKTIQTISLITYLIEKKNEQGPFLVIVPLSTLTNWVLEFQRWAPSVRTVVMKGNKEERLKLYERVKDPKKRDWQVCLVTYEYVIRERIYLARHTWVHMIIDEGHRMKNVKSKLSQTLNEYYRTKHRLILTGTPLQNNLPELWALLNFVLPKIFNSVKSFDEWFNAPFANTGGEKMEMNEEEALLVVKRLHKVLRPFLLRRLKKDVESELPDKVEKVIYTRMSALQWKLYESVKKYKRLPTDMTKDGKSRRNASLQNAIMQLRKICNHPFVFPEVDEDFAEGHNVDESIVRTAGKFELLDRILPKLFATGHKVLIFFQMTEIMTIIADFFDYRGWKYCRLDGSTKAEDRQTLLSTFNDPQSPYQVFILSTRAGGLGLNLQSADTVIIYDTDWNPHADLQAQDRAHRIGQKKEVRVLRLISSQTVEELVLQRAQRKLEIDGKVIQAGKFDDVTTSTEYEELLAKAFEAGADNDNEETNELDDDELNELLARGDNELATFTRMDREREENKQREWRQAGHTGPMPPPLMQESELPPFYRRDMDADIAAAAQEAEAEAEGRGRRAKQDVKYTDGLTDEQWIDAMDNSDDDVEAAADRKRQRALNKAERKRMNNLLSEKEAKGEPLDVAALVDEEGGVLPKPKKRGRPSKSATPSVLGDDGPAKKRKLEKGGSSPEVALMWKLYNETNAQKSDVGEDLNVFFIDPVDKKLYPDYYQIISKPIAMVQIKRKIGRPTYTLEAFKADMHLLWDNARTYNEPGSWVYNAAEDMQAFFDEKYDEEVPKLEAAAGAGPSIVPSVSVSATASGTSTPMYKPQDKVTVPTGTKIKLNMSAKSRLAEVSVGDQSEESEEEEEEDDDDDDDY